MPSSSVQHVRPKGSVLRHVSYVEDESMHAQTVYPILKRRDAMTDCGGDDVHTCAGLLRIVNDTTRAVLEREWLAVHVDPTASILIQKSPTFDVALMEAFFPRRAAHALVMRHPFFTHCHQALACWQQWHGVWRTLFNDVLPAVERYAVVQYEAEYDLAALAPALLCDHEQRRLRLEDGGVLDFSKFNDPMSAKFDAAWNRSASEVEELARWEPTAFAFGYSVLSRKDAFANVQDGIFATHAAPLPRVDW